MPDVEARLSVDSQVLDMISRESGHSILSLALPPHLVKVHLLLPLHGDSLEHLVDSLVHVSVSVHLLSFGLCHLDAPPPICLLGLNAPFAPGVRSI